MQKEIKIPPEGIIKIKKVLDVIQRRRSLNPTKQIFNSELGGFDINLKNENEYLELVDTLEGLQKRAGIKYAIDKYYKPDRLGRRFPITLYDSFKCEITITDDRKYENYYNEVSQEYLSMQKVKEEKISEWLVCGRLKFNKENGDVILGEVKGNFAPETNEYKVFLCLLSSASHMTKYTTLLEKMYPGKEFKEPLKEHQVDRWALDSVMRNIRTILGILPRKNQRNKDIFQTLKKWKGYRIICE